MNASFKPFPQPAWSINDNGIVYNGEEISFAKITSVELRESKTPLITDHILIALTDRPYINLCFPRKQRKEAEAAYQVLLENHNKELTPSFSGPEEYRKKCNVCGAVWCYDLKDLKENRHNANMRFWNSVSSMSASVSALKSGSKLDTMIGQQALANAESSKGKVIDYKKCPHCGSTNIRDLEDSEWAAEQAKATQESTPASAVSAADELKKFKELLDMGVITQEEFDAKKKQLLGL